MEKGKQTILQGALILTASTMVVKVIGALFKIPLANILGGVGMSYFVSAYDVLIPIYSMTVTGLGVAVSRMVSEYGETHVLGDWHAGGSAAVYWSWTIDKTHRKPCGGTFGLLHCAVCSVFLPLFGLSWLLSRATEHAADRS